MREVLKDPAHPHYLLTFNPETITAMLDQIERLEREEANGRYRMERMRKRNLVLWARMLRMRKGMGQIGQALHAQGLTDASKAVYALLQSTAEEGSQYG
jgi:hypothetical protein